MKRPPELMLKRYACRRESMRSVAVRGLGALEQAIMDCVWAHDRPVTCREVVNELTRERSVAYTTVLTVMDRLARKGMLTKQPAGRAHADGAVQSRAAYTATLMASVLGSVEDPSAVLLHFIAQLSPDEAERLRAVLNDSPTGRERPL